MVSSQLVDQEPQADVVFVIEATSMNGTYVNELKSSYIHPILEYFNQGPIENNEHTCENRNCLYTIILYHSADIRPKPCCRTYAQEKDPHCILSAIDKVKLVGGKTQSNANIVEGLATCLQFFDDVKKVRDSSQKYCILICSSPPYAISVMENEKYSGNNLEQLATVFSEKKILVSILSPRKIPALFKLYEKAGGDLNHALGKNYSKNARHLILLNGFSLKERAVSPSTVPPPHNVLPVSSPKNPGNIGSPTPAGAFRQTTTQPAPGQVQHISAVDIGSQQQKQSQQQSAQQQPTQQQAPVSQQLQQPQQQQQTQQQQQQQQQQVQQQQQLQQQQQQQQLQQQQQQQQLQQQQQQQQQLQQQQQQQLQQQQAQQQQQQQQQQPQMPQQQLQHPQNPQLLSQQQAQLNPGARTIPFYPRVQSQAPGRWSVTAQQQRPFPPSSSSALIAQLQQPPNTISPQFAQRFDGSALNPSSVNIINQAPNPQMHPQFQHQLQQQQQLPQPQIRIGPPGNMMNPQQMPQGQDNPCTSIWQGILEWTEKTKSPNDMNKSPNDITRQVPCTVTTNTKEGEPEIKADNWPSKLVMQLLPKQLIGQIGSSYLKNSTSVLFHPQPCDALDALTKVMTQGFAGCVQFNSPSCEIKVLILLYTSDKKVYLGFIPNDQPGFVERLRKQIQLRKTVSMQQRMQSQSQTTAASQTGMPSGNMQGQPSHFAPGMMPTPNLNNTLGGQQQSHLGGMMVGEMSHGGVNLGGPMMQTSNNQQSIMLSGPNPVIVQQGGVTVRHNSGMMGPRSSMNPQALDVARQQNLLKMQQLKQSLEEATHKELQYQKQQQPQYGRPPMMNLQQPPQPPQQSSQPVMNHTNTVHTTSQSGPQFADVPPYDFLNNN